ncbi:hypothetical protein EI983_07505 [Roseovarius faecimaris]|uniref:Uncharacterized protein n=1 Tax=Roseovarius faecimaris TaxID=2494550 RepID=A0A6I6IPC2_9RHOB|nr:hypothetical protein [Roseovarius faecimaris]QGX98132.1 hypothetical protein EI983_07505 [Roseovarius faecimaris]
MRSLIVMGLSVMLCLGGTGPEGLGIGKVVYAGGDGGNNSSTKPSGSGKKAAKKDKKPVAYVPDTDDLRASKGPQARMHDRLEDLARKDGLQGLGTNLKRLKKFRKALDRLIKTAKTREEKRKAAEILTQLKRYRDQSKNKPLSKNAERILSSLGALDALDKVETAESAFYKAKLTTKGTGDDIETNETYKDAVKDYKDALKKVPKTPRSQFPRFESTLLKN